MRPATANKTRQLSLNLEAEEHRMVTTLAEKAELSVSDWLRGAIREAFRTGGLESLPQRIRRAWEALEAEHVDYLRRCGLAYERHAPRPPAKALERRIGEMLDLIESRAERKGDMRSCLVSYRSAVARALPGVNPPEKLKKELQEKYNELWFCIDEWLDEAKAKT